MKPFIQKTALFFAGVLLVSTIGCRKPEMQRCVDQDHIVVDDDLCHATSEQRILGQKPKPSGSYRYYYGGTGSTETGTIATGGSYMRLAAHTYAVVKEHDRSKLVWPLAIGVGLLAVIFFGWEGRGQRP
jgi:hypothetical protein